MNKQQIKKTIKIALMIYLTSFLIINWNEVSWIFNYRTVSGLISDFLNPYPSIDASAMSVYFYPNNSQGQSAESLQEIVFNYTEKQNILEIPKLSLEVPIIFPSNTDTGSITKDLDKGVVYYPGSVLPGQKGRIIILGHSAPQGWPKIKHDWVFSDLDKLTSGDAIFIDLNNKQYKYIVNRKTIIKRGQEPYVIDPNNENNILMLISCWPPGKDYQRIVVEAMIVN